MLKLMQMMRDGVREIWYWLRRTRWREATRWRQKLWATTRQVDIRKPLHAVVVGVLVAGILAPVFGVWATNARYRLSEGVKAVIADPAPHLMSKLKYNNEKKANVFNGEASIEAPPTDPNNILESKTGAGKNQLYTATLPDDPSRGVQVHDNVNDVTVSFTPEAALMGGRAAGGQVIYPLKDKPGQMIFTPKGNGLKEDIALTSAPGTDTTEFHYKLDFPSYVQARLEDDGTIGFYTPDQQFFGNISYGSDKDREMVEKARTNSAKTYKMFAIPRPIVHETGKSTAVTARFALYGHDLVVYASGLKEASYPLSIDPTFLLSSTADFTLGSVDDNIDLSQANQVGRAVLSGGSVVNWNVSAFNTTSTVFAASLVAYNGILYLVGGRSVAAAVSTRVEYNPLDLSTGAFTSWSNTSSLQTGRQGLVAFGFNGYLYAVGGEDTSAVPISSGTTNPTVHTVEYAPINSDGTVGTWAYTTGQLNQVRSYAAGASYQGYLYVLGGSSGTLNASQRSDYEYAHISGNGDIPSWTTGSNSFTTARNRFAGAAYNGFVYIAGGLSGVGTTPAINNDVQYSAIQSDGSLGTWSSTTSFPTARRNQGIAVNNGHLYVYAGCNQAAMACPGTGMLTDVQYAVINADGTIGQWQRTLDYNHTSGSSREPGGAAFYSNHLYFVAGCNVEGAATGNTCTTPLQLTFYSDPDDPGRYDLGVASLQTTAPFNNNAATVSRGGAKSVALNGYLYHIGGCSTSGCATYNSTVEYAPLNANGTLGTFNTTTVLPAGSGDSAGRMGHTLLSYNNKVYVIGGTERKSSTTFPAPSAAPTTTTFTSAGTTHNVNMPATVSAGDLLVAFFTNAGSATVTTPGGWTAPANNSAANSTNVRGTVLVKNAAGTEGGTTVNFVTSASIATASAQVYRIPASNWYGAVTKGVEVANTNAATTTTPDPPSLTPSWGSEDNLWLAYVAGTNYTSMTTAPTNYTSGTHTVNGAGVSTTSAQRGLTATTENPGTFTMGNTSAYAAFTIAIRPNEGLNNTYMNTILSNSQNSNGTLGGSWTTETNNIPAARAFHISEIWHNFIYVIGGRDASSVNNTVYYSQLSSTGTVGTWTTNGTTLAAARWGAASGIWGNWIYVIGGQTDLAGTYIGTTAGNHGGEQLAINQSTGAISSTTDFAIDTARRFAAGFAHNGELYTFGGILSSGTAAAVDISWTALDPSTGAPGTFVTTNIGDNGNTGNTPGLTTARSLDGAVTAGGNFYVLGGCTSVLDATTFRPCTTFVSTAQTTEQDLVNNGGTGQTNAWATGSGNGVPDIPTVSSVAGRADHATVAYNGFLYIIGGCNGYTTGACTTGGTSDMTDIEAAAVNPSGTLGSWTATGMTALPSGRSLLGAVAYNGYLYAVGGRSNSASATNTVWYAPISSTGTIGTWVDSAGNYLPANRVSFGIAIARGYIYALGGTDGTTKQAGGYYTQINTSDGSLTQPTGSGCATLWCSSAVTAFTTARTALNLVSYNGDLYVAGGQDGSSNTLSDVQYAATSATDGSIASWNFTTDIGPGQLFRQMVAANGYMYFLGNEGATTDVMYVDINANGTLGMIMRSANVMSGAHAHGGAAFSDGFIYDTGGCTLSSGTCSTVNAANDKAGQLAIARVGHYSKLFNTEVNTSPSLLQLNGSLSGPGSHVGVRFYTQQSGASSFGVAQLIDPVIFGNFYIVQALDSSGNNTGVAFNYLIIMVLDDSNSGTFPDVTSANETNVQDITLYYHANPGRRLRHGASFTNTGCNATPANGCILDTAP